MSCYILKRLKESKQGEFELSFFSSSGFFLTMNLIDMKKLKPWEVIVINNFLSGVFLPQRRPNEEWRDWFFLTKWLHISLLSHLYRQIPDRVFSAAEKVWFMQSWQLSGSRLAQPETWLFPSGLVLPITTTILGQFSHNKGRTWLNLTF